MFSRFVRLKQWFFSEFLIHAADVEGLCQGIDEELVSSEARRLKLEHLLICFLKSWVNGLKYLRLTQEVPKVQYHRFGRFVAYMLA